jgi:hypothetical protein
MEKELYIFIVITGGLLLIILFSLIVTTLQLKIRMYFLLTDISHHPFIEKNLKQSLLNIAKEQDVEIFYLPFDELNKYETDEDQKAAGVYIHMNAKDGDYENLLMERKKLYKEVIDLENKYKMPYHLIYQITFGKSTSKRSYDFCVPRIMISTDNGDGKINWIKDKLFFHKTLAHELGHHFSIKYENDRSERSADIFSADLIYNNNPNYIRLFYGGVYDIVFKDDRDLKKKYGSVNGIDYWKLIFSFYWNYYRKRKKLNET